jgi:hypothetical protein
MQAEHRLVLNLLSSPLLQRIRFILVNVLSN